MKPYKILTTYVPPFWGQKQWPKYTCQIIGEDLIKITAKYGLEPLQDGILEPQDWCPWVSRVHHAEVKRYTPDYYKSEDWHKDGDLDEGANMDHALALWTTKFPTQLSTDSGITQAHPFELILFRNLALSHRRPPEAPRGGERHFFRQRLKLPKHIKLP